MACAIRLELMRALGVSMSRSAPPAAERAAPFWRQIMADVFDTEIVTVNVTEGAAYGAALLAGVGAGVYADVRDACARTIGLVSQVQPGANARVYAELLSSLSSIVSRTRAAIQARQPHRGAATLVCIPDHLAACRRGRTAARPASANRQDSEKSQTARTRISSCSAGRTCLIKEGWNEAHWFRVQDSPRQVGRI